MSSDVPAATGFRALNLSEPLQAALDEVGYETPTPIQSEAIPHLLAGLDLLGHAPTGTGKTAAFALPLISRLDIKARHVQVMTLTPTRELAIQVAEAFQRYASHVPGFHVLPIYGGQDYSGQIRQLKRGVHVVVGTPGRVMDHMRKGTLQLDRLQALVLDEADEMLRMGFIDEVEWILGQTPEKRQMALFSATMPKEIARIARRHLNNPQDISIKARTATAELVRQRYWLVGGLHKLDALTRILEAETFDAVLIFVRTKIATVELAERLEARGYSASALNGDMQQKLREQMVARLKKGALDILVATDVAARGLDVDRISHVINYDIPYDTEAYIHRIGRTGRAGRMGDAILFVAPRERRMLRAIEKATRQPIEALELPSTEVVNNKRIAGFKQKITDCLAEGDLAFMQGIVEQYQQEHDVPALDIAAALAKLSLGDQPLLLKPEKRPSGGKPQRSLGDSERPERGRREVRRRKVASGDAQIERFRLEVGHDHGVEPSNIVGAIANEAGMDAQHIGRIDIQEDFSIVELPVGMPAEIFNDLKKAWVCGRRLNISRLDKPEQRAKPVAGKPSHARDEQKRKERGPESGNKPEKKSGKKPGKKAGKKADKKPGKKPGKKPNKNLGKRSNKNPGTESGESRSKNLGEKPGKKSQKKRDKPKA